MGISLERPKFWVEFSLDVVQRLLWIAVFATMLFVVGCLHEVIPPTSPEAELLHWLDHANVALDFRQHVEQQHDTRFSPSTVLASRRSFPAFKTQRLRDAWCASTGPAAFKARQTSSAAQSSSGCVTARSNMRGATTACSSRILRPPETPNNAMELTPGRCIIQLSGDYDPST